LILIIWYWEKLSTNLPDQLWRKTKLTNIGGNLPKYNIFKTCINFPLTPFDKPKDASKVKAHVGMNKKRHSFEQLLQCLQAPNKCTVWGWKCKV
jgi:hypothetical protein